MDDNSFEAGAPLREGMPVYRKADGKIYPLPDEPGQAEQGAVFGLRLLDENAELRKKVAALEAENDALREQLDALRARCPHDYENADYCPRCHPES